MSRRLRTVGRAATLVVALLAYYASSGYGQITRPVRAVPVAPTRPVERGWMGVGVEVIVLERDRGPANSGVLLGHGQHG